MLSVKNDKIRYESVGSASNGTHQHNTRPEILDTMRQRNKIYKNSKVRRSPEIYQLIGKLRDKKKRNLIRGYAANQVLSGRNTETLRRGNSPHDSVIVGAILKGPNGLLNAPNHAIKKSSGDLYVMTPFPATDWKSEVRYTAGYLNSVVTDACLMLDVIKSLAKIDYKNSDEALDVLLQYAKDFGASNFLSYKLAYLRSITKLSAESLGMISQIEDEFLHREHAGLHFSALENISPKISIFVVAQRRISGLIGHLEGDFRRAISLSNFVPTPIDQDDVAGFLLRATESCLIDTVYAVLIIFNLSENLDGVYQEFLLWLDPDLIKKINALTEFTASLDNESLVTEHYMKQDIDGDHSLAIYRICAAFLERPTCTLYRNKFDRVIGVRLLAEIRNESTLTNPVIDDIKALLLAPVNQIVENLISVPIDSFYRTYLFLRFIENPINTVSLSAEEITFIFENTSRLEMLLTEKEMRALYASAAPNTKGLVSVLALALFRKKSVDPDADFEFRTDFIFYVNEKHGGSVLAFIEFLLKRSPQVATYIVESLNEITLEKMYTLVKTASEAAQIRGDILRAVGQKLNQIEYIIEADAIATRSKLLQLQNYFDSSRMYVDSVAMKRWLDSNPTVSTEQYRALYPVTARIIGKGSDLLLIRLHDQDEYLISQIAKDAFEQFCLNAEFGIQSYLGRRIRHNTLDGVTTETVDAVFHSPDYRALMLNPNIRKAVDHWMSTYKGMIHKLRRDYLQFKTKTSINPLFDSSLDLEDPTTKENVRWLSSTLRLASGSELLNDLVISFCWRQIAPQLDKAARFIRTQLLQEVNSSIDRTFLGYFGVVELQLKADLHQAVNEVLKKVADWFQVPQTGFVSASVRDLCQIIQFELNIKNKIEFGGNAVGVKYTGISVHRLYDCLAVLLQNAHKHGETDSNISILASVMSFDSESEIDNLEIQIISKVTGYQYQEAKTRILHAIDSKEASKDMVTEGYTGINKIKFITRASEGTHTVNCVANDQNRCLTVTFSLHAERANENALERTTL